MFKKTILLAGASYFLVQKKTKCSPQPPLSMILRGSYQNKIRRFSPPEKIFDVFATIYEKGRLLMSLTDLLKAICFYNFSASDETHVEGFNPAFITKFLGKNDRFEIYDYFILARFLAFEKENMQKYYQKNSIYEMTQEQFAAFLLNEVCRDYVDHIKESIIIESRQFKPSKQQFEKKILAVAKSVYEENQSLSFQSLQRYRKSMISQLYQFEFLMFPIENQTIDGVDFARSIIKYVEPNKTKKYMKRIKHMTDLENIRITMKAYKAFHMYMWSNMHEIEKILTERGAISTNQLADLINKYVNKKGTVTPSQIDVVVRILDHDDSGFLEKKEVLGVLKNLQYYSTVKSGEVTFLEAAKQDFEKLMKKIEQVREIVEE